MWQKREGEWEKERQARERLMKEVGKLIFEPRRDFQQCGILTSVDSDEPV